MTKDMDYYEPLLRLKLLVSEVAELAEGLNKGCEVEVADAVADILYVAYGTAVAWDLPADLLVRCVHESNMTKGRAAAKHDPDGDKGKGRDFVEPDVVGTLQRAREFREGFLQWAPGGMCDELAEAAGSKRLENAPSTDMAAVVMCSGHAVASFFLAPPESSLKDAEESKDEERGGEPCPS